MTFQFKLKILKQHLSKNYLKRGKVVELKDTIWSKNLVKILSCYFFASLAKGERGEKPLSKTQIKDKVIE